MDPNYYLIAAWLSSLTPQTKRPELSEAAFKPFDLSNL